MMKALIVGVLNLLLRPLVLLGLPVFYLVARTGVGAELCRRFGFQPIRVHYYQPIPEYEKLPDEHFTRRQELPGFRIEDAAVRDLLSRLGRYAHEISWPADPVAPGAYHTSNPSFGLSSGALLYTMIRTFRSRRVIEIGGGYSSLVSIEALEKNHGAHGFQFTCIEPYPLPWLERILSGRAETCALVESAAQMTAPTLFLGLSENDILFVDSSHVSKLGSDVNFVYLQILPRLNPGVIVHIHDIYIPYEYPKVHFFGQNKFFWNEQYLLQAFLTDNPKFEILLPGFCAQRDMQSEFSAAFPMIKPGRDRMTSSFWMRKKA
jgi:hypothetical protein